MMLCLALFIVFVFLLFFNYAMSDNRYWKKQGIVQVNGVLTKFISNNFSLSEIYKDIYEKYPKEKYIGLFLSKPALIVTDVQDIQEVLQGNFHSFHSRGIVTNPKDTLTDSVLFMEDYTRWKLMRQKLSPIFTTKKLKNMFYIMNNSAYKFANQIQHYLDEKQSPFDILYAYSTASVTATIFSIDIQIHDAISSPFLKMTKKAFEPSFKTNIIASIANTYPKLFKFLNLKSFADYEDFFIGTMKSVLENRRNSNEIRHDFIDACIELQKSGKMLDNVTGYEMEPTIELLAAQAFFFFLAGIDTTTTTIHFALLELAGHSSILTKVHEEIDEVFERCDNNPTFDEIENMVYLDKVISETMRKFPPVGVLSRLCTKNTILPAGKIVVEKDVIVLISVFGLHRNDKYYTKPEVFDPERFAPENAVNIEKFTYLPFGDGNRVCIGARYARLQIKTGLAWLLRKFTLKEQKYEPKYFDKSFFAVQDKKAKFELIARNVK